MYTFDIKNLIKKRQPVKEALEKLSKAKKEWEARKAEFSDKYEKEIQDRIGRYIKAEHSIDSGYEYPHDFDCFEWHIDETNISGGWHETWSRGGEDRGYFDIPIKFFLDDGEELTRYEKAQQEKKDQRIAKETQRIELKEIETYKQLKSKYGY